MRIAFAMVLLALGLLCSDAVRPSPALGDADPASDVLIGTDVFYPYSPVVSPDVQKALDGQTQAAKRSGFPIKIALIASPPDLGAIEELFGRPQQYASFLDQEFGFMANPHPPLLVVMANGYGVAGLPPASTAAARSLPRPAGRQVDDLARAAIVAVRRLAAADGHRIPQVSVASGGSVSTGRALIVAAVVLAAVAGAGAVITSRRRPRHL